MQGCNDCAFDNTGNLWITAPAGEIAPAPYKRSFEVLIDDCYMYVYMYVTLIRYRAFQAPFGSVYCYTSTGEMKLVSTGYWFPNGIAVQHSKSGQPKLLIVAETKSKTLWSFDIKSNGEIENKRVWATVPGILHNHVLIGFWGLFLQSVPLNDLMTLRRSRGRTGWHGLRR